VNVVNFYKEAVGELLRLKQEIFMPLVHRVKKSRWILVMRWPRFLFPVTLGLGSTSHDGLDDIHVIGGATFGVPLAPLR
jgi:hypothetical protein